MTTEQTTAYRDCLEQLAQSRGLPGAQELAQGASTADPRFTAQEILEDPGNGFGHALDAAISLTEEEKVRLSKAWMHTFLA